MKFILFFFFFFFVRSVPFNNGLKETITQAYNWIANASDGGGFSVANTHQNQYDLYSGSAGVLVYTLELYKFTNDPTILNLSKAIAGNLQANFDTEIKPHFDLSFFHKGLGGIAFAFHVLYDIIPNPDYESFANSIDKIILDRFPTEKMPNILRWGYAGTGLYLMWLYDRTKDQSVLDTCVSGTEKLIKNAVGTKDDGLKWYYQGKLGIDMPGYADGTAGVCYMLARLYEETGNKKYLDYAKKGMIFLNSVANFDDNGCLIFYSNNPFTDAEYYLEECNGNAGHIKAFLKMYNVTGEKEYLDLAVKSGNSVLKYYPTFNWWLPKKGKKSYFWNTMSLCDGSVGVVEALNVLRQYSKTGEYDKPISDIMENIVSRKHVVKEMAYWTQAENRDQPDKTWNQVGMYQGAAGITMTMMHLLDESVRIRLPDYLF